VIRGVVTALVLMQAACGRLGFDQFGSADPDATSDGDDMPPPCAFTFCDTFDRDPPLQGAWDNATSSSGALQQLIANEYQLALPAPALHNGFLEKTFPASATRAKLMFRLSYASATPGTAEIDLVQLKWNALPMGCTSFGYYLVRDGTGPFGLQETYGGCGGNENTSLGDRDNSGYHDVLVLVTFGAIGDARIRVDVDGTTLVEKATSHAIAPSDLMLRLGGGAIRNMSDPWLIRYDDVFVQID
jgi:hypothetical protein